MTVRKKRQIKAEKEAANRARFLNLLARWEQMEKMRDDLIEEACEVFEGYYDLTAEMVEGTDMASRKLVRAMFNRECDIQDDYQRTHPDEFGEGEAEAIPSDLAHITEVADANTST